MNLAEKIEGYKLDNERLEKRMQELPEIIEQLKNEGRQLAGKMNANIGAMNALEDLMIEDSKIEDEIIADLYE